MREKLLQLKVATEAEELGISIEEYQMWKSGYEETYIANNVIPIEGVYINRRKRKSKEAAS